MNDIRTLVLEQIRALTPEVDPAAIGEDEDIREALDFDSMDILTLTITLGKQLAIDIPEADARRLTTIGGAIAYLTERTGTRG